MELTQQEALIASQILQLLSSLYGEQAARVLAHVQAEQDGHGDHDVAFSRGIAGPLGKLEHVLKTKVDERTHALFLQQCAMERTDASNQLRNCVYALVHGKSYDAMVIEHLSHKVQRTEALAKLIRPFGGPESGGSQ